MKSMSIDLVSAKFPLSTAPSSLNDKSFTLVLLVVCLRLTVVWLYGQTWSAAADRTRSSNNIGGLERFRNDIFPQAQDFSTKVTQDRGPFPVKITAISKSACFLRLPKAAATHGFRKPFPGWVIPRDAVLHMTLFDNNLLKVQRLQDEDSCV
jgi:hypothetical protein